MWWGKTPPDKSTISAYRIIIKGDLKYGAKRSNKDASIHLLAQKLEFIHPVKKAPLTIIAHAPKDSIWKACGN